jgi:hypothetical protein
MKKQEFQATRTLEGTGGGGRRAARRRQWRAGRRFGWEKERGRVNRDAKQTKTMEKTGDDVYSVHVERIDIMTLSGSLYR